MRLHTPTVSSLRLSRTGTHELRLTSPYSYRLALFCGGRGSNTILTELVNCPWMRVTVLVNGYDDGKSSGHLRRFLPDMLGPSDFRKNLALLAGVCPGELKALRRILDYRLPQSTPSAAEDALRALARGDKPPKLLEELSQAIFALGVQRRHVVFSYLGEVLKHCDRRRETPVLSDCAFGNLLFAGAYLSSNRNFNSAVHALAEFCEVRAELLNVTRGEARILTALKANGEVLFSEASIVGPQSCSPLLDFFLLPRALTCAEKRRLDSLKAEEKREFLKAREAEVKISREADEALRNADLIVYGPGTQYSSLFPSYRTRGLHGAIRTSRARAKVLIANLERDHDTQELNMVTLVDRALEYLGDPRNDCRLITHLFYSTDECSAAALGWDGGAPRFYKQIQVIQGKFADSGTNKVHCGHSVVQQLLKLSDFEYRANSNST